MIAKNDVHNPKCLEVCKFGAGNYGYKILDTTI